MMSVNSPQYLPSFQLNRAIAEKAETYGFNFLLSMVKLRGFGGRTEFWNHNLESFTLMAGLAAVTEPIQLFVRVGGPAHPATGPGSLHNPDAECLRPQYWQGGGQPHHGGQAPR
jgi:hypothetical protein